MRGRWTWRRMRVADRASDGGVAEGIGAAQATYDQRVRALEEQIQQTEAAAEGWKSREEELVKQLQAAVMMRRV